MRTALRTICGTKFPSLRPDYATGRSSSIDKLAEAVRKVGRALSFGPVCLTLCQGIIATEDARPTNGEGQGFLRTIRRTIGDGIRPRRSHEAGKPHSRHRRRPRDSDGTAASSLSAEVSTRPSLRSLRAASMARCAGSSGGVAFYRRDPLVEAHQDGRGLCYNFLYEIKLNPRPSLGAACATKRALLLALSSTRGTWNSRWLDCRRLTASGPSQGRNSSAEVSPS